MKNKNPNFRLGQATTKASKKKFVVAGIIILLLVAGAVAYFVTRPTENTENGNSTDSSEKSESSNNNDATNDEANSDDTSDTPTSQDVPTATQLALSIKTLSQANGMVTVQTATTGSQSAGTCVLSFSATESKPVVRQVESTPSGSEQVCSATIPEVEFDKLGNWLLTATFFVNDTKATATKNIVIN